MVIKQPSLLLIFSSMAPDSMIILHSGRRPMAITSQAAIEAATQAFGLHVLEDAEVDYLFSLTDREEHAGFVNEFSDRENIMKALLSHSDEIKRDRPALAAKLDNFDKRSVKELLQVD